jgi:hypothetical protein
LEGVDGLVAEGFNLCAAGVRGGELRGGGGAEVAAAGEVPELEGFFALGGGFAKGDIWGYVLVAMALVKGGVPPEMEMYGQLMVISSPGWMSRAAPMTIF